MMKVGICSDVYARLGKHCYEKMREHGYSCLDYHMSNTNTALYNCTVREFESALSYERSLVDEAGIEITHVHGPWRWPIEDATAENRAERMEKMKKSLYGTAVLGCKNWVIHPIMPCGICEVGTPDALRTWEHNMDFMSELLQTAKENDITICLENMPMREFSLATPEAVLKFVRAMNDDHFKICFDTGHAAVFEGITPGDAVRELRNEIRVLHVHDNNGQNDDHLFPGLGIIDWADFHTALTEIGFEGSFSLEVKPMNRLSHAVFEEMCLVLMKIVKEILNDEIRGDN